MVVHDITGIPPVDLITESGAPDPSALQADYIALLGIQDPLHVDAQSVRTTYLKRCREIHPDFHPECRDTAERLTARLNDAWATLSDHHQWLEYLILRLGGRCPQTDKTTRPETLMTMLELQEEVESINDRDRLAEIRATAVERRDRALTIATEALENSRFDQARLELNEASYCRTLIEHVDSRLAS